MVLENNRFHEIMGEMSGNVYLQANLGRLLIDHARIGHTFFRPRDDEMNNRLKLAVEHMMPSSQPLRPTMKTPLSTWCLSTGNCRGRTWRCSSPRPD